MRKLMSMVLWLTFSGTALATGQSKEAKRLESAAFAVNEIMQTPEQGIPRDLLDRAICVGVIPSGLRFAIGLGGSYGRGALVCRKGGNGPWGAPSMFTLYGVNFGYQVGAKATDIVFIVMNTGGVRKLLQSGVKLGDCAPCTIQPTTHPLMRFAPDSRSAGSMSAMACPNSFARSQPSSSKRSGRRP